LSAFERLNLRLLVEAQDDRVCRRVQIEPDHVLALGDLGRTNAVGAQHHDATQPSTNHCTQSTEAEPARSERATLRARFAKGHTLALWPGGLFLLPDEWCIELPKGTEIDEFEDGFVMVLPDGTVLDVALRPSEGCCCEFTAHPPPARLGEPGMQPITWSLYPPSDEEEPASEPEDGHLALHIVLDEPDPPWYPPRPVLLPR
jgi:hypothetical protein